jgi:hypothetical protein
MGHGDTSLTAILSPEFERVIVTTGRLRRRDPARDGVLDAARSCLRIEAARARDGLATGQWKVELEPRHVEFTNSTGVPAARKGVHKQESVAPRFVCGSGLSGACRAI